MQLLTSILHLSFVNNNFRTIVISSRVSIHENSMQCQTISETNELESIAFSDVKQTIRNDMFWSGAALCSFPSIFISFQFHSIFSQNCSKKWTCTKILSNEKDKIFQSEYFTMVCFSFIQHALRSFMIFCNFSWIKIPPHNFNKIILCISSLVNRGDCSKVSIFRKLLIACVLFFSEWSWMQVFNAVNRFLIFTGLGYGK